MCKHLACLPSLLCIWFQGFTCSVSDLVCDYTYNRTSTKQDPIPRPSKLVCEVDGLEECLRTGLKYNIRVPGTIDRFWSCENRIATLARCSSKYIFQVE